MDTEPNRGGGGAARRRPRAGAARRLGRRGVPRPAGHAAGAARRAGIPRRRGPCKAWHRPSSRGGPPLAPCGPCCGPCARPARGPGCARHGPGRGEVVEGGRSAGAPRCNPRHPRRRRARGCTRDTRQGLVLPQGLPGPGARGAPAATSAASRRTDMSVMGLSSFIPLRTCHMQCGAGPGLRVRGAEATSEAPWPWPTAVADGGADRGLHQPRGLRRHWQAPATTGGGVVEASESPPAGSQGALFDRCWARGCLTSV
jgi:hypothetical protein